jgi:hypothetical protein
MALAKFTNLKRYLEIGVWQGGTFNAVDCEYKVAVDPKFQFDYLALSSGNIKFYETTSDQFFLSDCEKDLFDIVFIDGLHTWNQTLRDFNNSLLRTHDNSVIVIDDVYPCDVYSSLLKDAVKYRKLAEPENTNAAWHGDVFKTIFIIHDFYPLLSFVTIDYPHGNPQTLVIKRTRKNFTPRFKSIEEIERLSYFDFLDNIDLLNLKSESEALDFVKTGLTL